MTRAQQESYRLREKLSDLSFYKSRVEELQKDNANLYETRATLETEVAANRIRLTGFAEEAADAQKLRQELKLTFNSGCTLIENFEV